MTDRLTDEDLKRLRSACQWHGPLVVDSGDVSRLLSEVTALRREVANVTEDVARALDTVTAEAMDRDRWKARAEAAESLLSEVRALVDAHRRYQGPSAFSGVLWETLTADDAATAPAEPAGAVQGGGAVSGEVDAVKSDTQTFARPMTWAGLGKD